MKRTALVVTFKIALVLSAAVGVLLVNVAVANPTPWVNFPTEPDTTMPTIALYSPVQGLIFNSTNVWLNFSIIKPDMWIQLRGDIAHDLNGNPVYLVLGNVTLVYYVVDEGEQQSIPMKDVSSYLVSFPSRVLNFSTNFTLAEGTHSAKIGFNAECYYLVLDVYTAENATRTMPVGTHHPVAYSTVEIQGASEPVSFTVVNAPEPLPEPTVQEPKQEPAEEHESAKQITLPETWVIASVVAGVAACVGAMVYFKKRNRKQ